MATAVAVLMPPAVKTQAAGTSSSPPPVLFLYNHLHDAIRKELDVLSSTVFSLDSGSEGEVEQVLLRLKERYRFLEQVYKYHSAVEDEVVYPALDSKVKNVTSAYSVEHQDEEYLFEQLGQLIGSAISQSGAERAATVRQLVCKVEAIHTTLRKHLAKEEAQLLPLLLAHFSYAEQAELVAQFLYCIPLDTIERVLTWLRPAVPPRELQQLLVHLRDVVPDNLLLQLLVAWLNPPGASAAAADSGAGGAGSAGGAAAAAAGPAAATFGAAPRLDAAGGGGVAEEGAAGLGGQPQWPPLKGIVLFHASIKGALEAFVAEAAALQAAPGGISTAQLAGLVERHRFLRSVCAFHTHSEEEVMFPEVMRLSDGAAPEALQAAAHDACSTCRREHVEEVTQFEGLGRLLADVRALARRGRREAGGMLGQLVDAAQRVCDAIYAHMRREESDVLPLLSAALPLDHQRAMVWRTLRAMPLRLLERVMPWLVAKLSAADTEGLISTLRLAAPEGEGQVVELLLRWADRGRWAGANAGAAATGGGCLRASGDGSSELSGGGSGSPSSGSGGGGAAAGGEEGQQPGSDDPSLFTNNTCGLRVTAGDAAAADGLAARKRARMSSADGAGEPGHQDLGCQRPRWLEEHLTQHAAGCPCCQGAGAPAVAGPGASGARPVQALGGSPRCRDCPMDAPAPARRSPGPHLPGPSAAAATAGGGPPSPGTVGIMERQASCGVSPIDHIFQFHKALRQELRQLEADAAELEGVLFSDPADKDDGVAAGAARGSPLSSEQQQRQQQQQPGHKFRRRYASSLQQLEGRFQFLRGIYRAHSRSEDEIVFPALESKEALHNISHAYTLDHAQEENLFLDLEAIISRMQQSLGALAAAGPPPAPAAGAPGAPAAALGGLAEARELVLQLRRMCAAVRASLETHVRAEEAELWPLFAEHFTFDEQQHLVGVIIGRTGAEVLQALLPWVTGSFSEEEAGAMMESLRAATRNTSFDQWLGATMNAAAMAPGAQEPAAGNAAGGGGAAGAAAAQAPGQLQGQQQQQARRQQDQEDLDSSLAEIAEYLVTTPLLSSSSSLASAAQQQAQQPAQQQEASGTVAESSSYRPGWEEIFNINQKQLEAAIRRVSNDPSLEPQRKAYIIQNIMVSRYIVGQQRRMRALGTPASTPQIAPQDGAAAPPQALTLPAQASTSQGEQLPPQQQQQQQQRHTPTYQDAAAGILGCRHYRRRAQLVAPCCGQAFTCRLCHDEATGHRMDRYAVSEMACMECGLRQPVAGSCAGCGASMARYYCSICHLFDDEPGRSIYHCPFCNVCRRGQGLGVDFFHCMQCNACMSLSLFNQHTCRERAMEGNCPVCHEYLFDSHAPIKELPCGHFLHSSCFAQYTRYNYTCPVCCKSIGDMSVYFKMIDSLLAAEAGRLPAQYAGRTQLVLCHDCGRQGLARWHFVYHSCQHCRSYNTRIM